MFALYCCVYGRGGYQKIGTLLNIEVPLVISSNGWELHSCVSVLLQVVTQPLKARAVEPNGLFPIVALHPFHYYNLILLNTCNFLVEHKSANTLFSNPRASLFIHGRIPT